MKTTTTAKPNAKAFRVDYPNDWCPGCGDFGILGAMQQAFAAMALVPHEIALVGGIGCSGKAQYYVNCYGVHTLHGRPLPFAAGIKLAKPELTVVIVGGDGDGLGIGAGHFVNAGRRNLDLTYILFNNEVYGLTKGQAAPTLEMGLQTKSLPEPTIQSSIDGPSLAHASGFTWIGRGYSYNVRHLTDLVVRAVRHPGLAYLEVLQPCPTYNDLHDKEWYSQEENGTSRLWDLQQDGYDALIPQNATQEVHRERTQAFAQMVTRWDSRIPVGVMLENLAISTYTDRIAKRVPPYRDAPPARRTIASATGHPATDLSGMFSEVAV